MDRTGRPGDELEIGVVGEARARQVQPRAAGEQGKAGLGIVDDISPVERGEAQLVHVAADLPGRAAGRRPGRGMIGAEPAGDDRALCVTQDLVSPLKPRAWLGVMVSKRKPVISMPIGLT